MKQLILLALLLTSAALAAAQSKVYKTVDENGNVIFTDQPPANAEEIEVDAPQTFDAPRYTQKLSPPSEKDKVKKGPAYKELKITYPEAESAIRENAGNIVVRYTIQPGLQANHSIQLVMDGQVMTESKVPGSIPLTNVDRGTHVLQLRVVEDESGDTIQSSGSVSTTILRHSVLFKKNRESPKSANVAG